MASSLEEARSHDKYPTYEQYDSLMHFFAGEYPEICTIDTFGTSTEGRLLLALKISDNADAEEDEPAFFYTATIHGNELVGYNLSLRFIDFLLQNYPDDPEVERLVNDVALWINPLSNPDATYYPDNNSSVALSIRSNVNGYDLNRNFPDVLTGVPDKNAPIQKETRAMMDFMHKHRFNLSANLHSGAEVVNYPWDHTHNLHPDNDWFYFISREYADEATVYNPGYMDGFTDGVTNGADWYVINGGRQDYVTYYLQGREITLELSNVKKIESENLETYWTYNKRSLLNLASQARYGIHGKVFSKATGTPVAAKITIPAHDDSASFVMSDSLYGSFYRYIKEGVYDLVVRAEGYRADTVSDVQVVDYQRTELLIELDSTEDPNAISPEKITSTPAFKIYPNPASKAIYIDILTSKDYEIQFTIHTLTGQTIEQGILQPVRGQATVRGQETIRGQATIRTEDFIPGVYMIILETPSNRCIKKFILQ